MNSLSPQEIRDKIMDPNSEFQKEMVEYLESVHVGEFMTGTVDEVKDQVHENMKAEGTTILTPDFADPTSRTHRW